MRCCALHPSDASPPVCCCPPRSSRCRYIGFLTRCALSKPYPELSIINRVKTMAISSGRISAELATKVFGDSSQGDNVAYAGSPTARPQSLRTLPFCAVTFRGGGDDVSKQQGLQFVANQHLRHQLHVDGPLRDRFRVILGQDNGDWDVDGPAFEPAMCLRGVVRDRAYDKVWDSREDGKLVTGHDTNFHVFACACSSKVDSDSGVLMSETVDPRSFSHDDDSSWLSLSSSSSVFSPSSLSSPSPVSLSSSLSSEASDDVPSTPRHHPPLRCSQRAPFEYHEDIAYGLVKRWIAVRQGPSAELSTIIAHVRIFYSAIEVVPDTGSPIIRQASPAGYEDHYMLARHIVCRITLSPYPNDTSRFLVSHVA